MPKVILENQDKRNLSNVINGPLDIDHGGTGCSSIEELKELVKTLANTAYLTFSSENDFTLNCTNTTKYYNGILEYSVDIETWIEWDRTTINSQNGKLYLRGSGNTYLSKTNGYTQFIITSNTLVSCSGNIETLLDWKTVFYHQHPAMNAYCFACLFYNCTNLLTCPSLPSTNLDSYCYYYMFRGCTNLTTIPQLDALTLKPFCYEGMFRDCANIKLSSTKTDEYSTEYRLPTLGTSTSSTNWNNSMFSNTGGTYKGSPSINTIYYTSNEVV